MEYYGELEKTYQILDTGLPSLCTNSALITTLFRCLNMLVNTAANQCIYIWNVVLTSEIMKCSLFFQPHWPYTALAQLLMLEAEAFTF